MRKEGAWGKAPEKVFERHVLYDGYRYDQRPFLHQNCIGKAWKSSNSWTQVENACGLQAVNIVSKESNKLELNAHAFKSKAPIQLLRSLHILAVLKPFYCGTKWASMQSALGMVLAEIKLLTLYKTFRTIRWNCRAHADDTVVCISTQLSNECRWNCLKPLILPKEC